MSQTWIISGPPGCGKTSWILNTFKNHSGNCGYVRFGGYSEINLEPVSYTHLTLPTN